jgi:hypothetical protein
MDPGQSSISTRNCGFDARDRLNGIRTGIRTVGSRRSMVDSSLWMEELFLAAGDRRRDSEKVPGILYEKCAGGLARCG